jgi:MarR family 2-MHQ and catechol resistance regulon transcriptional repressor
MEYSKEEQLALKAVLVNARMINAMKKATEKKLMEFGLTLTEFDALEPLYNKGELPLKDLSEKMLMANGSVTYVINKLEKRGLVKRVPSKNDRRVYHTSLTDEGYKFFDDLFQKFVPFNNTLFSSLTVEEREQYIMLTKKLGKSIEG